MIHMRIKQREKYPKRRVLMFQDNWACSPSILKRRWPKVRWKHQARYKRELWFDDNYTSGCWCVWTTYKGCTDGNTYPL